MADIGTGFIDVEFKSTSAVAKLDSMLGGFSSKFTKVGVVGGAALGAGIAVGVGVALYKIGQNLEEAQHLIREQTGATGEKLRGLMEGATDAATKVPVSFEDAAKAISRVNQRLGLTGEEADKAAVTFLKLGRVTGTDASDDVDQLSKVMARWNVRATDSTKVADLLFRAHEKTGVALSDLAGNLTKGGVIFQRFGYDLGSTTAIMARLDKSGFNVSKMTMGLNKGLAGMAAAGQNPTKAFPKLIDKLQGMHDKTRETALAVKVFGTRAGVELVSAIGKGVFANDKLTKSIANGRDTVAKANKATLTLGDYWTMFRNKIMVAVAPAAERIVTLLTETAAYLFQHFGPAMAYVRQVIEENWPTAGKDIANTLDSITGAIRQAIHVIRVIWNSWFGREMFKIVKNQLRATWEAVKAAFRVIRDIFNFWGDLLHGRWDKLWGDLTQLVKDALRLMLAYIRNIPIVNAILTLAGDAFNAAKHLAGRIKDGVVAGLRGIAGAVGGAAASAVNALVDVVNRFGIHIHKTILGHGINVDWSPGLSHVNFAEGGVVSAPTMALIGETARARPEVVAPEHLLRRIMREEGGGGTSALTITNWNTGEGYLTRIADRSVHRAGQLAGQRARMAR